MIRRSSLLNPPGHEKIKKISLYISALGLICSTAFFFHIVRTFIIGIGEKVLGRDLNNDFWMLELLVYAAIAFSGFAVLFIIFFIMKNIGSGFYKKFKYDIVIFLFLGFQLSLMVPEPHDMQDWIIMPYALNYTYGFASRFLIGSLLNLIVPYLTMHFLFYFILSSTLLLCFLLALYLGSCIRSNLVKLGTDRKQVRKSPCENMRIENIDIALKTLIILYLASPASPATWFPANNFGRLDIYLYIFSLLSLFCIKNEKYKCLIPVFTLMSVATHQVFVFTFFPLILGAILYYIYHNKFNQRAIFFSLLTLLITCVGFIYFQFFSQINFDNVDEFVRIIQQGANIPISIGMIIYEYFTTDVAYRVPFIIQYIAPDGLITIVLMLPLHIILIRIFLQAKKHSNDKVLKAGITLLIIFLPVCTLPAFVLHPDWGRWFAAFYTVQVLMIFHMVKSSCTPFIMAAEEFGKWIRKNWFITVFLVLYLSSLDKFNYYRLDKSLRILHLIMSIIEGLRYVG